MKTVSTAFAAHLAQEVTTLATCWKITRSDGFVMGFTDIDKDIVIESVTYHAATGFTPTAIATSSNFSVDNLDVEGMLDSSALTETDIMAGKYDFAEIEIFLVNYADISQGALKLRRGWLGEVSLKNNQFVAEVRGLMQRLSQSLGEIYSPLCRAQLGDGRCTVNMAAHTVTGSVTSISNNRVFFDTSRTEAAGTFDGGKITFNGGLNAGLSMEVKEYTLGKLSLALALPYTIAVGDHYTLSEGCDKTLATCQSRFDNAVNFRGEPHVPGLDRMLETSATRTNW